MISDKIREIIRNLLIQWPSPSEIQFLKDNPEETLAVFQEALEICKKSISELNENGDPEGLLPTHKALGSFLIKLGEVLSKSK